MKFLTIACAAVLGAALLAPPAHAYREDTSSGQYTAADKFGRGLADMTTGFLELPGNIVAENRDHGAASAATIGFAKGIGMIPVRELVGVYNFVTAPFPVPSGYRPILHPEYPWGYFQGSRSASLYSRTTHETQH
jgi:putative exosortase-associated protein (TIGR04073 family)